MKTCLHTAIIGTGLACKHLMLPALLQLPRLFKVVALCNPHLERAREVAQAAQIEPEFFDDVETMFNRVSLDAAVVTVPISASAPVSQTALRHKVSVLQLKPAAADSDSASASIQMAQANSAVFMVGENYRYHAEYKQMRTFVEQGVVGQPRFYHFNDLHLTRPGSRWFTSWRMEDLASGGYLVDGGVHAIAALRQVINNPIHTVQALSTSIASEFSSRLDNLLLLNLTFSDGFLGQAMLSNAAVEQETRRHKVFGDDGTIALLIKERRIELWPAHGDPQELYSAPPHDDDYLLMFNDFYQYAVNNVVPTSTAEDALVDLQVIEAALKSAHSGLPVSL